MTTLPAKIARLLADPGEYSKQHGVSGFVEVIREMRGAFDDRVRVIEMQLEDKKKLQATIDEMQGVIEGLRGGAQDAAQALEYALARVEAVKHPQQFTIYRDAIAKLDAVLPKKAISSFDALEVKP